MKHLFDNTEKPYDWVDIDSIRPTVINPINEVLRIKILQEGMLKPIIVREDFKLIMFGNQRYAILKDLNIKRIPVRYYQTKS